MFKTLLTASEWGLSLRSRFGLWWTVSLLANHWVLRNNPKL